MKSISEFFLKPPGCFVILVMLLLLSDSCTKKAPPTEQVSTESVVVDTLPDDFVSFYDRFHTDSQYQIDHIIFPLEGLPNSTGDGDTLSVKRYFWQRADWKKHNHFTDPSNQFEHWYEVLNDRIIEHWVQMKGTDLVIRRRFAKMDDEWFLIYYAGMRPLKKEEGN